jgi:type II secretory pathway pseudopilin PulG
MNPVLLTILIIVAVLLVILVILYFAGRKLQKKQAAQESQMEAVKQTVHILVIDKKKMRLRDAGLPAAVLEQTPKIMRRAKLPIVKAKVGPQIMSLVCDAKIFDLIPVKKEVKVTVSGIYISDVKPVRGQALLRPSKKKGRFKRFTEKMQEKAGAKPLK